jgi:hypothetical protein
MAFPDGNVGVLLPSQHRADVLGGFRRRRDKIVPIKPLVPRTDLIESDPKWGIARYVPRKMKTGLGGFVEPPKPR